MRHTGIVKRIEKLGRISFPAEFRRDHGIVIGMSLDVFDDGKSIKIKIPQGSACLFCGNADYEFAPVSFKGKLICTDCLDELKQAQSEPAASAEGPPSRRLRKQMVAELQRLIVQHPHANQKRLGRLLGVSSVRVSQLYKELMDTRGVSEAARPFARRIHWIREADD